MLPFRTTFKTRDDVMSKKINHDAKGIVITANAFFSGEVVYLGSAGWQPWISEARVFPDPDTAEQAMLFAAKPDQVVGAYVIEVETQEETIQPVQFREKIRAIGPTNYHHGKQEQAEVSDVSI